MTILDKIALAFTDEEFDRMIAVRADRSLAIEPIEPEYEEPVPAVLRMM